VILLKKKINLIDDYFLKELEKRKREKNERKNKGAK